MHTIRVAGFGMALVFLVSACTGSGGSIPPASSIPALSGSSSTDRLTTATVQAAPTISVDGTVQSISASSLLLKGTACGYITVRYGSSTVINLNGYTLAAGAPIHADGTGSCSTQVQAAHITVLSNSTPISIIGSVQSVTATSVLVAAGSACGMLNVTYDARTSMSGPQLKPGTVLFATGTGSCSTQLAATQIIVTSTAVTSIGGTVYATHPSYLLVQTGTSCGFLNIYFGVSSSVTGPAPAVGSTIRAVGTGNCATQLLATSIAVAPSGTPSPVASASPQASPTPVASAAPSPSPTTVPTTLPTRSPVPTPTVPGTPTLYVSTTGSDTNPGTQRQPFATIQHATDMARPGDTVSVADGTYTAKPGQHGSTYVVLQSSSGTAAAPIVVRAANPGMAILDGQNYATNFCYGFNTGANDVTVTGFTMQHCGEGGLMNNSAGKGNVSSHNVIHDIGQTQSCETTGRDGIFSGAGVVGFTSDGDTIYNIGRLPSSCSQSWLPYTNDHCVYAYGSHITIKNDTISGCHSGWGIQIGGGSASTDGGGFTIANNTFGSMNNPGGIVGDIVTFTPSGGHVPTAYNVTGNHAQDPNGSTFINNIYYPGAASYVVGNNTIAGASTLIDWGGQTPHVSGSGNTPAY